MGKILKSSQLKVDAMTVVDEKVRGLLSVKTREVREIISRLPEFCNAVATSSSEAKVLMREHTCLVALPILEAGCIISGAEVREGEITWNIVCDEESFLDMVGKLEGYGVDFEIIYKGEFAADRSEVTYREEEILKIALEKGYFDYPKKIRLEELAKLVGIAPSTLSEILRRGTKKVLERYFGD